MRAIICLAFITVSFTSCLTCALWKRYTLHTDSEQGGTEHLEINRDGISLDLRASHFHYRRANGLILYATVKNNSADTLRFANTAFKLSTTHWKADSMVSWSDESRNYIPPKKLIVWADEPHKRALFTKMVIPPHDSADLHYIFGNERRLSDRRFIDMLKASSFHLQIDSLQLAERYINFGTIELKPRI